LARKPHLPTLAVALLVAFLALASPAAADLWSPESGGSPNADRIDTLYWIIFAIALVVFVGVEGALLYSLLKFKARKGAVAAQIRGNTRLEIGWTVGAALILVALSLVTFVKLDSIRTPEASGAGGLQLADGVQTAAGPQERKPPGGKALNVCVNGQQYLWRFTYSDDCKKADFKSPFSYEEMVVPVDTTVTLDIVGQDVAHSWWIPKLGGKMDAIPGYHNYTWFKVPASRTGEVFTGQCAELCGRNHANMTARVRAVSPADYEAWLDGRKADITAANQAAQEQRRQIEGGTAAAGTSEKDSETP
jgi:cytochrome c oxidase subunit 2